MSKDRFKLVLTENPGEVDSTVVVEFVTTSLEIAMVWSKGLCHMWENEDGNGTIPDEDNITHFVDASGEDPIYQLEFIVLLTDEDTGDLEVIENEEDMPKFVYNRFTLMQLHIDPSADEDSVSVVATVKTNTSVTEEDMAIRAGAPIKQ
jgi:hypothetical protein